MKPYRYTLRSTILAAVSAVAVLTATTVAGAESTKSAIQFNIKAQPLQVAILEFSRQARVTVVAPAELLRGHDARNVVGAMVPEEALTQLISGTGLKVERTN